MSLRVATPPSPPFSPLDTQHNTTQLKVDNIHILHTIGGDDTNTQAALLSAHLLKNGYSLTVIGMPKTIDNDVHPIKQTFGADTASIESAKFFRRIVAEGSASPRMLIIHEVMGRDCGYLTARSAHVYREMLRSDEDSMSGCELWGLGKGKRDIHAVFIPEIPIDLPSIGARLKTVMDDLDVVNVFLSEGAGVSDIVSQMESEGQPVPRDAFGHVQLAKINPGEYLSKRLGSMVNAEKTLVQKSGYFARAAPSNDFDQRLIEKCARVGAECAMRGVSGCMGQDEERGDEVRPIEFERIRGGKVFDINTDWFQEMMGEVEAYGNGK